MWATSPRHEVTLEEVEEVCHGVYYPVTARPASRKERALYEQWKGGEGA